MQVYRYSFYNSKRSKSRRSFSKVKRNRNIYLLKDTAIFVFAIFLTLIVLISPASPYAPDVLSSLKTFNYIPSQGFVIDSAAFLYHFVPGMEEERKERISFIPVEKPSVDIEDYLRQYPQLMIEKEMIGLEFIESPAADSKLQGREKGEEKEQEEELSAFSHPEGDTPFAEEEEKDEDFSFLSEEESLFPQEIDDKDHIDKEENIIEEEVSDPLVLIYHTHTTESFIPESGDAFTEDLNQTVVFLGEYLHNELEEVHNIDSLHHREIFDIPRRYAYEEAGPVIDEILDQNPRPEVVIDLHRDGVSRSATTTSIDGENTGRILFVVGSRHENWHSNLRFALYLHERLEEVAPGISRGVRKQNFNYNQNLHPRSVIVEIGGHENTAEEVKRSIPYLAEAITRVFD